MDQHLLECLGNQVPGEYILPFFWQHGEDHPALLRELEAIHKCGLREFCVESRPHPHFCEEHWWDDFSFLLQEAQKRDMRVWLLDDKRFPTGYANNYIENHQELRAVRLRVEIRDFVGPQREAALVPAVLWGQEETLLTAVACRLSAGGDTLLGKPISLMPLERDGLIWWDIPPGVWRVTYVIRTTRCPAPGRENYIDMLSPQSCNAMIKAVYDPHFRRFGSYFGSTFAGFFSDEPGFSNELGSYHALLGNEHSFLPWNDSLIQPLSQRLSLSEEEVLCRLPALWQPMESVAEIREAYMEEVTLAFRRNFSFQLGEWCRAHGVEYIGHVIEDENAHQRLGHGCGHYFRALDGQDMAGIDIVLHQYIPGMTELSHTACLEESRADPAFFQYTLPKLASSHAHLQPLKRGRALCEIYGGFGWAEGVPEMKQMTDLMLSGGINHFVPHAFDPKLKDPDHPPHFFEGGKYPQYEAFAQLMAYTKRMSHLLSGGRHQADVAVYYNAEAEWAGGKFQLQQEVCKVLSQNQITFDLVYQDLLLECVISQGKMSLQGITYRALVVPYSQYLPAPVLEIFHRMAEEGLPVLFTEALPDGVCETKPLNGLLQHCLAIPTKLLPSWLRDRNMQRVITSEPCLSLRMFHIRRNPWDVIFLWNESLFDTVDTWLSLPGEGLPVFYDGWKNQLFDPQLCPEALRVRLAPEESIAVVTGPWERHFQPFEYGDGPEQEASLKWTVSLRAVEEEEFTFWGALSQLENLASQMPEFSGWIRYETTLMVEDPASLHGLKVAQIGEVARLWVNGHDCGFVMGQPARFSFSGRLRQGENRIRIDVIPNLGYSQRDRFSSYVPLPVMGLQGPVSLN